MHNTMYLSSSFSEETQQVISQLNSSCIPVDDKTKGRSFGQNFVAECYKCFSFEEDYSFKVAASLLLTRRSYDFVAKHYPNGYLGREQYLRMSARVLKIDPQYMQGIAADPALFGIGNLLLSSSDDRHFCLHVLQLGNDDWNRLCQYDGDPDIYLKQTGYFRRFYSYSAGGDTLRLKDLEAFIKQQTGEELFIIQFAYKRDDEYCTIVFMRDDDKCWQPKVMHALVSCLPRLYPWLFEDEPVTDEEEELLHSLLSDSRNDFIEKAEDLFDKMNLLNWRTRQVIARNMSYRDAKALADAINKMDSYQSSVDNYRQLLRNAYSILNDTKLRYETLMQGSKCSPESPKVIELSDYIEANKAVYLKDTHSNDSNLYFVITTPLNNFDPDALDVCIDNEHSFVYNTIDFSDADMTEEEAVRLLQAIRDDEVQVIMSGEFRIEPGNAWYYIRRSLSVERNAMYNPHIERFYCFGGYTEDLDAACFDEDIISFLSTCVASVGSLNTAEVPTMQHFIRDLFTEPEDVEVNEEDREYCERVPNTKAIIQFPDGQRCTPIEAVRRLID